jgi:transposase
VNIAEAAHDRGVPIVAISDSTLSRLAKTASALFPACLDEYINEDNPVRVIDVFVEELDLAALGFDGVVPQATGRPAFHRAYHPTALLKIYIYGYLNRIPSSRRLEQETGRNLELMWLTGQLQPDHKTIARFRKDNGSAIQAVCRQFVVLCRNPTVGRPRSSASP